MKKSFFTLAALLFLFGNTAAYADTITGKVVTKNDWYNYTINSGGENLSLNFTKATELKPGQRIEVQGQKSGDSIQANSVVIVADKRSLS